jgi:RNA polymerase sigma factor (sigma-70 family)
VEDFSDFYIAQRDRVFRIALAASGNRAVAEDATAEAFARAFAQWKRVSRHPNPAAWVMLTTLNLQRSWWRRLRREASLAPPTGRPSEPSSPLSADLQRAVRDLPRRQREVVALRILGDLSAEQTADVLGIAVGTVGVHLHRALTALRQPETNRPTPATLRGTEA